MQMRYQLRHSPRLPGGVPGNSRNLSQRPRASRNRPSGCTPPAAAGRRGRCPRGRPSRSCRGRAAVAAWASGQPSSSSSDTFSAAPWDTTTAVSPGRATPGPRRARHRCGRPPAWWSRCRGPRRSGRAGRRRTRRGAPRRTRHRHPGALAEVVLPEPGVDDGGRARSPPRGTPRSRGRGRGRRSTAPTGRRPGEVRRDGGGLRVADLVERDVGVALGPRLVVPGGAAVPEQDEPACGRRVSHAGA